MSVGYPRFREIDLAIEVDGSGNGSATFNGNIKIDTAVITPPSGSPSLDWEICDRDGKGVDGDSNVVAEAVAVVERICVGNKNAFHIRNASLSGSYTVRLRGESAV